MTKRTLQIWVALGACLLLLCVNPAFAKNDGKSKPADNDGIDIIYPENNRVVSGFFIPVSWKDNAIESTSGLPYPQNYAETDTVYHVAIVDKHSMLVEKTVTGQNFYIFTFEETEGLITRGEYTIEVTKLTDANSSGTTRIFYEEPNGDILNSGYETSVSSDATAETTEEPLAVQENISISAVTTVSATASSTSCSYCYTSRWGGMLVLLLPTSVYTKNVTVTCNSITWYSNSFSASYSGAVFVSLSSGNFKLTYSDSIYYSVKCPVVNPWQYTVVQLP